MAIQTINIGTNPNDGTGDDLRTAFDKVNDNFAELLAVGGETNTATNLGIGEGVFKQKTAQDLEFKTLRNNDGKITITSDANSIYLNTNNLADNDFGAIQVDNGDTLTASSSSALFGIKGGNSNIAVTKSGNDIVITGAFEVSNDATPQLGGDLSILSRSIIGGAGSSITNIGSIDGDSITADTLTVNTTSGFGGTATFTGGIIANGGLTLGAGQTLTADVSGGFQGQLTGTLDTNGQAISGNGPITIDTAQIAVQGTLGTEFGLSYRSVPSPFTVQTSVDLPANFLLVTSFTNVPLSPVNVETVIDKSLSGGQSYQPGSGSIITFSVNDNDSNPLGLGVVGGRIVDSTINEIVIAPLQTGRAAADQPVYFTFNSSGIASLNEVEIGEGTITTNVSNKNLTLSANGSGKVDFYGAYQFPDTIGNAGEVLTVPLSGTVLEWGAGGGGGGGSSTFVGLSDTPASYAGSAADALKFVRVAASGTALEFVTLTSVVDSTYIDTNGGLLKAGGTMTGNINMGTQNISNATQISATTFQGSLSGDVSGATTVSTTTLNVSTIDTSDSSEITITPGVKLESYLTVESSLNVLDTTTTKNLTVSNDANITGNTVIGGTLTADNFALSGGGAPSFTSGSDINFTAAGQLSTNAPLVPTTDNSVTLGTASFKWSNVYATTFTGNVIGNVTGDVTGNADTATEITATANNTTNETVYLTFVDGATGVQGIETDTDLSYNPSTNTLTAGTLAGNVNATTIDVGNIHIENNSIETASNGILRLRGNGTGYIELDGNVRFTGTAIFTSEDLTVSGTASPVTLDVDTTNSFVTTSNWTAVGADFAYADLADGTTDGQTKMIKVVSRGEFSVNGGATFTDRYLVVNLKINGSVGTLNVSQNSEYGAVNLIWHNSSWWVTSQFDS
jgi:hypothetical protein